MTKEAFMHAYSSDYYDPVKAHEYYERNKKLKGRSTSGMSDEQKSAWEYVKGNITTQKKQKSEEVSDEGNAQVEALRSEANEVRARISEKIKAYLESIFKQSSSDKEALTKSAQKQKEAIEREKQSKIDALPKIPLTASPAQKERLRAQNAEKKAAIIADAKEKLTTITEFTSEKRSDISDKSSDAKEEGYKSAAEERKVVADNLKSAISSVRDKVKEIKETLNSSTEETLDKEYLNIMSNIAGKPAKAKKAKKAKASKSGEGGDEARKQKFIADNLARLKSKG